ncbi:hypothetical protein CRENBAI_005104 [Crenichthys baileyi]|uniref:Uncharacterized protein n=1 Tax=Crenichthys baileyi TaxID=28760 RepID=A0AAV9S1B0_9TELE
MAVAFQRFPAADVELDILWSDGAGHSSTQKYSINLLEETVDRVKTLLEKARITVQKSECNISGHGESPSSWISVSEKSSTSSPTTTPSPTSASPPSSQFLPYGLLSLTGAVVVVLLLVLLVKHQVNRKSRGNQEVGEESIIYSVVKISQNKQRRNKPNKDLRQLCFTTVLFTEMKEEEDENPLMM